MANKKQSTTLPDDKNKPWAPRAHQFLTGSHCRKLLWPKYDRTTGASCNRWSPIRGHGQRCIEWKQRRKHNIKALQNWACNRKAPQDGKHITHQVVIRETKIHSEMLTRAMAQHERLRAKVTELDNQNDEFEVNLEEPPVREQDRIPLPRHVIYNTTSPLSRELQQHPWLANFKPKIPK